MANTRCPMCVTAGSTCCPEHSPTAQAKDRRIAELEAERDRAIEARKHTQDWYGARWQRMHDWFRSPEMKDTKAAHDWFSIVANGHLMDDAPPVSFMASVNMARHLLEQLKAERDRLARELAEARKDTERLDWIIKQGPPGANDHGLGLTEETWDSACGFAEAEEKSDQKAVRRLIDHCIDADLDAARTGGPDAAQ